jgi:hypothetical protein
MNKLKLNLDELSIESFEPAAASREEGTVRAYGETADTCDPLVGTCFGYTCYQSCNNATCDTCDPRVGTCFGYTCYETCTA